MKKKKKSMCVGKVASRGQMEWESSFCVDESALVGRERRKRKKE